MASTGVSHKQPEDAGGLPTDCRNLGVPWKSNCCQSCRKRPRRRHHIGGVGTAGEQAERNPSLHRQ